MSSMSFWLTRHIDRSSDDADVSEAELAQSHSLILRFTLLTFLIMSQLG